MLIQPFRFLTVEKVFASEWDVKAQARGKIFDRSNLLLIKSILWYKM